MNPVSLTSHSTRRALRPDARALRTADADGIPQGSAGRGAERPKTRACTRTRKHMRRRVDAAQLAAVHIHATSEVVGTPSRRGRLTLSLAAVFLIIVVTLLTHRAAPSPPAPETERVFVFEDLPEVAPQARPDPSPPPPAPAEPIPPETPPPQFGLRQDQLSATGDLAVATGNTLMTEADTLVHEPVAALPPRPEIMDQAPRLLKGRPPEYPHRALERGLEATVVALITIDTLGRVSDVVLEQSGGREFDPEVIRAVKRLVFQPPVQGGRALPARFRQPYEFRVQ